MDALALIPARTGSKSIPKKNFTLLAGMSPLERAFRTASAVTDRVVISTDIAEGEIVPWSEPHPPRIHWLNRPAHLAQDDTPMLDVVTHALEAIPGPPEQIVLLVQPTQPLRQPKHLIEAVRLLRETREAESVVSVVALPPTHHPSMVLTPGTTRGWVTWSSCCECLEHGWPVEFPARRQDVKPAYIRDGTVYAFYRATVQKRGSIYGHYVLPYIIDPSETCPLDTPEDWAEAERRLSR